MVEWLHEVLPVEMRVDAEQLKKDSLTSASKIFGKPTSFARPVIRTFIRTCWKEVSESGIVAGEIRVGIVGNSRWVGWKEFRVVNPMGDPPAGHCYKIMRWQFNRFRSTVNPSV